MMICNSEYHTGICPAKTKDGRCKSEFPCRHKVSPPKPQTNADRIRAMTDEELAVKISAFCDVSECRAENGAVCPLIHDCPLDQIGVSWLDWLKQPYGGADHE